jgi:hypothetical protein
MEGFAMDAMTNRARIAQIPRATETYEDGNDLIRHAQGTFLDELPGVAFALITLVYLVSTLIALI